MHSRKLLKVIISFICAAVVTCSVVVWKYKESKEVLDYCDLTSLDSDTVFDMVYEMLYDPEEYVGKVFTLAGECNSIYWSATGEQYHYCTVYSENKLEVISLEVDCGEAEYPEDGEVFIVTGIFEIYMEDDVAYCRLKDAVYIQ